VAPLSLHWMCVCRRGGLSLLPHLLATTYGPTVTQGWSVAMVCLDPTAHNRCLYDVLFMETLSIVLSVATLGFTALQFYMVAFAVTSANLAVAWDGSDGNPYDLGFQDNFERFFGSSPLSLKWLLPRWRPPPGDGYTFPLRPKKSPLISV
jgi:hypothetical protein